MAFQERDLVSSMSAELMHEQLSSYFLHIVFQSSLSGPTTSPGNSWYIFGFEVHLRGPAPSQNARCRSAGRLPSRNLQKVKDAVPLSAQDSNARIEQSSFQGEVEEHASGKQQNGRVVDPGMLASCKTRSLSISYVHIQNFKFTQSIFRETKVTPDKIDELIWVQHPSIAKPHNSYNFFHPQSSPRHKMALTIAAERTARHWPGCSSCHIRSTCQAPPSIIRNSGRMRCTPVTV